MEHLLGRRLEGGVAGFLAFDVAIHAATLLAVLVYFSRDLARLVPGREPLEKDWYLELTGGRSVLYFYFMLLVTLAPLFIVYPLFGDYLKALRSEPLAIAGAFVYAGGLMLFSEGAGRQPSAPRFGLGVTDALLVGLAQAVALAPGASRSGMTMATGRLAGLSREAAFCFSFLMAIPAVAGALAVEMRAIAGFPQFGMLLAGIVGAFISGLLALATLRCIIVRLGLWVFGAYCVFAGILTIIMRAYI